MVIRIRAEALLLFSRRVTGREGMENVTTKRGEASHGTGTRHKETQAVAEDARPTWAGQANGKEGRRTSMRTCLRSQGNKARLPRKMAKAVMPGGD